LARRGIDTGRGRAAALPDIRISVRDRRTLIYYFRESSRGAKNFGHSGRFSLGCGRQPALWMDKDSLKTAAIPHSVTNYP
jgi:hypothetical protein